MYWSAYAFCSDLNADPADIPCLANGISAGRYVDLALAYSLGAGLAPDATCRFSREGRYWFRVGIFLLAVPNALAASQACYVTDRWFTPHFFLYLLAFVLVPGWPTLLALLFVSLFGLLVGWILLIGPSSSSTRVVQDVLGCLLGMNLGWFLRRLFLHLGDAVSRSSVDVFLIYLE